jgi:hypothetical protein
VTLTPSGQPTQEYDNRFGVYRIDYSESAADHVSEFVNNDVFDQLSDDLNDFRTCDIAGLGTSCTSVAAVQFDLVAHSLGGLVARDTVLDPQYLAASTFNNGYIHKLITIGTPHDGTPIANNLLQSSLLCQLALAGFGHVVGGAVQDLAVNSLLLTELNTPHSPPIKAHAIVGLASSAQEQASELGFASITWGVSAALFASLTELDPALAVIAPDVCTNVIPAGGYQQLFNGNSDLLVPQASQSSGFSGSGVDVYVNIIHTVLPALYPTGPDELNRVIAGLVNTDVNPNAATTPNRLIQLLNTSVSQNSFVLINP